MILAMFCLSNNDEMDEMLSQMAEAYGGVGGADGNGRWGGQRSLHLSALGFAIVGTVFGQFGAGFVDLISTGRHLRKKCFGQSVTKGFIVTLPEAFSRRSTVHRAQIDTIEHLGVVYCVDHLTLM